MKFVLASYGTRGDIEPSVVVARELQRRGHDVVMAVPPDLISFTESAGLETVSYGLDTKTWLDVYRNFWTFFFHTFWKVREIRTMWRQMWELSDECWAQMNTTLMSAAQGADVLFAGQSYQEPAANVAEYHDIPLVTLHHIPMRPNGQLVTILPSVWAARRESLRLGVLAAEQEGGGCPAAPASLAKGLESLAAADRRASLA